MFIASGNGSGQGGGWTAAIYIIAVEMAERFAYYGVAGNLMIYLTEELGEETAAAAKNINNWNGILSLFLLVGAVIADSSLGRFRVTLISTIIFLLGLILQTLSVSTVPHHLRSTIFFTALYLMAIGDGGHRPSVQTFAADQFDETTPEERKAKSSFFNWWYVGIVIAAMVSTVVVTYVQENISWTIGFAIPAAMVLVALAVFLIGSRSYRRQTPVGSPFTRIFQVVVAAFRKRNLEGAPEQKFCYEEEDDGQGSKEQTALSRTNQFRFLDKATIIDEIDRKDKLRNPWRLCSITQVEELKLVLRLLPIWLCSLAYAIIVAQVHTFFIKQARTINRHLGHKFVIPPAYLQVIPGFIILAFVPVYDKVIVPYAIKVTKNPYGVTPLQRIGIGLALSIVTIVISALVEIKRIKVATKHGLLDNPKATVPMSVWWMSPQFFVMGLSDLFAYVGLQELFYDQMPEGMRSVGAALTNASIGVGALLSSVVISMVQGASRKWGRKEPWLVPNLNRAHLDYFYWILALFGTMDLLVYVILSKWFVMKKAKRDGSAESGSRV